MQYILKNNGIKWLGAAGVLVGYPLDTVKVKIQTQDIKNGNTMYKGTFDCLFKLVRKDGVIQWSNKISQNCL